MERRAQADCNESSWPAAAVAMHGVQTSMDVVARAAATHEAMLRARGWGADALCAARASVVPLTSEMPRDARCTPASRLARAGLL